MRAKKKCQDSQFVWDFFITTMLVNLGFIHLLLMVGKAKKTGIFIC